jgi:predicted nucleic acid-binding protein
VSEIYTAVHARAEFASAAFRKVREGAATHADFHRLLVQFKSDLSSFTIILLPLTDAILDRIESVLASAPPSTYLRAADALHLATAAENGFTEIYSNDKHLLTAAPLFGLAGVNVIP